MPELFLAGVPGSFRYRRCDRHVYAMQHFPALPSTFFRYSRFSGVRGESLGGGKVRIVEINHVKVDFTGEYSAIIVIHQDTPGVVAYITRCLSERNINIAFMRLFRESKGTTAYTIVESDGHLPEDIVESIHRNTNIHDVMVVQM